MGVADGKHHVEIGGQGFIVAPGSYQRSDATPQAVRMVQGDPRYDDLSSWSAWTQGDWVGGMDQPIFQDPQMFLDSKNIDTLDRFKVTLARELRLRQDLSVEYDSLLEGRFGRARGRTFFGAKQIGHLFERQPDGSWDVAYVLSYGVLYYNLAASAYMDRFNATVGTGLSVDIGTGRATVGTGRAYNQFAPVTVTLAAADATNPRIDLIVIPETGAIQVITGTPSASPVPPAVPQNAVPLWQVYVAAGATSLTANDLTDVRQYAKPVNALGDYQQYLLVGHFDELVMINLETNTISRYSTPDALPITALKAYKDLIAVALGPKLYFFDPKTGAFDAQPLFEASVKDISVMAVYAGLLYFAGFTYLGGSRLYYTDALGVVDVYHFPEDFYVYFLQPYWGSLYIGGGRYTESGDRSAGILYEMRGNVITPVKEFGGLEEADRLYTLYAAYVYEDRLWISGNNLTGFLVYDAYYDAWSVNSVIELPGDRYNLVRAISSDDGYLVCQIQSQGLYVQMNGAYIAYAAEGWIESSEFDAGLPTVEKYFAEVEISHTALQAGETIEFWVSYDGGAFTKVGEAQAEAYSTVLSLAQFARRAAWKLVLKGPGTTRPEVHGVAVRYVPLPEEKYVWSFTLLVHEGIELLDGTVETATPAQMLDTLWQARNARITTFVDRDGVSYEVIVRRMSESAPELNSPRESYVAVTLLEV